MENTKSQTGTFRLESNPGRVKWFFASLFFFGITSLYFYVSVMLKLNNYYSLLLAIPFYGYICGQAYVWIREGIRAVEANPTAITIFRPRDPAPTVIPVSEIGSIRVTHTLDGLSVLILLHGATSTRTLGVVRYSGPHFRISQGPFEKKKFQEFITRISTIKPTAHN